MQHHTEFSITRRSGAPPPSNPPSNVCCAYKGGRYRVLLVRPCHVGCSSLCMTRIGRKKSHEVQSRQVEQHTGSMAGRTCSFKAQISEDKRKKN